MSTEQVRNLVATTLASGYTAASGSIEVADATGFPTTGTFRVSLGGERTPVGQKEQPAFAFDRFTVCAPDRTSIGTIQQISSP